MGEGKASRYPIRALALLLSTGTLQLKVFSRFDSIYKTAVLQK